MKQRLELGLNQQMRPILAADCEPLIEPRAGIHRTLMLEIGDTGKLHPVLILEGPLSIKRIRFDDGFDTVLFFLAGQGTQPRFYELASVRFERDDPEDKIVRVMVTYESQFVDQLVAAEILMPFLRFFIPQHDEPLDDDEVKLEEDAFAFC